MFALLPKSESFPQLDVTTWPSQIFWLVIALVALYVMLTRFALPKIEETLEEREATITRDLDRAAEFNRKAEDAEAAYEKALADARAEARRLADEAKAAADAQIKASLAEADAKIEARIAESEARIIQIRGEAAAQAGEAAQSVAEALIDRLSPSPVDAGRLRGAVTDHVRAHFGG